jgi:hypothetical protein
LTSSDFNQSPQFGSTEFGILLNFEGTPNRSPQLSERQSSFTKRGKQNSPEQQQQNESIATTSRAAAVKCDPRTSHALSSHSKFEIMPLETNCLPESGVIELISLRNFKCHTRLDIEPCKRTTFVTGLNGSEDIQFFFQN